MKKNITWALVAVASILLVSAATAPIGAEAMKTLLFGAKFDSAAMMANIPDSLESWLAYLQLCLSTGNGLVAFAAWSAVIAAVLGLYAAYQTASKPGRIVKEGESPLGSARLVEEPSELKRRLDSWNGKGVPAKTGLVISGSKNGYLFSSATPHWIAIAKTGGGKSQFVVIGTCHLAMAKGMNLLVTGKSELLELTGDKALELGYKRIVFDLSGYPGASGFNPIDLVAEYAEAGNLDAAQRTARQTAADLVPVGNESNSYFAKAARSALTAFILMVCYENIPRRQKNMASVYAIVTRGTSSEGKDPSTPLKQYIRELGPSHPCYGPASDFLGDGGLTTAGKNVISTLKEALTIFGDEDIRRITATSSHSIREIIKEKSICYFHLLEDNDPYQVIYKCFFNQYWRVAQEEATGNGGRLPRPTAIVGDELGNVGRIDCLPQIATLGRAMKLYLYIFVQNLKQLETYNDPGDNGAGRAKILGSIGGKVALSLSDPEDGAYFTRLAGKRTVRTHSTGEQRHGQTKNGSSQSYAEQADDLVHEWEWGNRVTVRDGAVAIIGGENSAPGREGVYKLPLCYAHETPAGSFFGLGDEDQENGKRRAFYEKALKEAGETAVEAQVWCPDFTEFESDEGEIESDEFAAWDEE